MTQSGSKMASGLVLALLVMAGCSSTGSSGTPEEQVARRAQERLDAMMAGDFERALAYTTPAFREGTTSNRYRGRYAGVGNWTNASVERVACEEERCNVTISVTYQMVRPNIENTRPLDEVWITTGGEWYIYEQ